MSTVKKQTGVSAYVLDEQLLLFVSTFYSWITTQHPAQCWTDVGPAS